MIPEELSVRSEASVLSAESLLSASLLSVSTLPIVLFSLLSLRLEGIYPCGEGAGYAGGITSAAMDGIKVAEAVASVYALPVNKM